MPKKYPFWPSTVVCGSSSLDAVEAEGDGNFKAELRLIDMIGAIQLRLGQGEVSNPVMVGIDGDDVVLNFDIHVPHEIFEPD